MPGEGVAGLAALFSADSHQDSEHSRRVLDADLQKIDEDLVLLAESQPGPSAEAIATRIRERLSGKEGT